MLVDMLCLTFDTHVVWGRPLDLICDDNAYASACLTGICVNSGNFSEPFYAS